MINLNSQSCLIKEQMSDQSNNHYKLSLFQVSFLKISKLNKTATL
jgi:hypothetical protein